MTWDLTIWQKSKKDASTDSGLGASAQTLVLRRMTVMEYGNPICEGDSIALSTNLGTMTVPKNIWEGKYEV